MSDQKKFEISDGTITRALEFSGQGLTCYMMGRMVKEIRLEQIHSIQCGTSGMTGNTAIKITYLSGTKKKTFPGIGGISGMPTDPQVIGFINELKERVPSHVEWIQGKKRSVAADGSIILNLLVKKFPYGFMGLTLSRSVMLVIDALFLCFLVVTAPLGFYQLFAGYRLRLGMQNMTVQKMFPKNIAYQDVRQVHFQPVEITTQTYGSTDGKFGVARFALDLQSGGRPVEFFMRYDEAKVFVEKMIEKGLMNQGVKDRMAA